MSIVLNDGSSPPPRRTGSAFGGGPTYSNKRTTGTGTKDDPYRAAKEEPTRNSSNGDYYDITRGSTQFTASTGYAAKLRESQAALYAAESAFKADTQGYGGSSIPASTLGGEGVQYLKYTAVEQPPETVSSQLRKAGFRDYVQEYGRRVFGRKEPAIIGEIDGQDYVLRDTRKGTLFAPGAPLGGSPKTAALIENQGFTPGTTTKYGFFGRGLAAKPVSTGPGWGQQVARSTVAGVIESPENAFLSAGKGYLIGYGTGAVLGTGTTALGRYTATKYGIPTALKATRAANTAIGLGFGAAGAGYLATTPPRTIGRQAPALAGAAFGFGSGFNNWRTQPIRYEGTTADYLGIDSSTRARVSTRRAYDTEFIANSATQTQEGVFSIYGKPVRASILKEAYFTGRPALTTKEGTLWQGGFLTRQTATIMGKTPYRVQNTALGTARISEPAGTSFYESATGRFQAAGFIVGNQPLPSGSSRVTSLLMVRTLQGVKGYGFSETLSNPLEIGTKSLIDSRVVTGGKEAAGILAPFTTRVTTAKGGGNIFGPITIKPAAPVNTAQSGGTGIGLPASIRQGLLNSRAGRFTISAPTRPSTKPAQAISLPASPRSTQEGLSGFAGLEPGTGADLATRRDLASLTIPWPTTAPGRQQTAQRQGYAPLLMESLFMNPDTRRSQLTALDSQTQPSTTRQQVTLFPGIPDLTTRQAQQPFIGLPFTTPTTRPGIPPPLIPGFPAIPLFGVGGGGPSTGSGNRGYGYEPSLVSIFGDIKGSRTAILTGLEVRKKPTKRKSKKRRR